jgi:hypothetical protein
MIRATALRPIVILNDKLVIVHATVDDLINNFKRVLEVEQALRTET